MVFKPGVDELKGVWSWCDNLFGQVFPISSMEQWNTWVDTACVNEWWTGRTLDGQDC